MKSKSLANVVDDYGIVTGMANASYRDNKESVIYYGASAERFNIDQTPLSEGRFYTQAEDNGGAQVVVLGATVAKDFFGQDDPFGKLLAAGQFEFSSRRRLRRARRAVRNATASSSFRSSPRKKKCSASITFPSASWNFRPQRGRLHHRPNQSGHGAQSQHHRSGQR